jgi:hypothetical protein
MRKIATALALATGLVTAGAAASPALADVSFRFGFGVTPYYGYSPYYHNYYYQPYGTYRYYRPYRYYHYY